MALRWWPLKEWQKNAFCAIRALFTEPIANVKPSKSDTLESKLGCRYLVLFKLPYFDFPRMLLIHPIMREVFIYHYPR